MTNNLATVHQMFSSFGQGDIPGVIACLADDVTFFNAADPKKLSFGGTFKGKDGALEYFHRLVSTHQITNLVPTNFREKEDGIILHDVLEEGIVTATGKPYSINILFTWSFDNNGKVTDWKATGDFSTLEGAFLHEKEIAV